MRTAALIRPQVGRLTLPIVAMVAAAAILFGFARIGHEPVVAPGDTPIVPAGPVPPGPARTYDELLAQQSATLVARRLRAAEHGGQWILHEQAARAAFARARLSGSYDDYALAQSELDAAFRIAPPGTGPHMSQAILDLMMHRLAHAGQMLDAIERYAVPPDSGERAEIAGMRGDIAFYSGDYAGALARYDEADRLAPGSADFRRAVFHAKTGRPDLAGRYYDAYQARLVRPDRHMRANMALQRGILALDAGRLDEAMARFREADALFPGWWLVQEHIAETTALMGDRPDAERQYRGIVARTGSPEFMDALAALLIARGASDEAEALRIRSDAVWQRRLALWPEASYGHALTHCINFGDTSCALDLARRNHAARPYGEAGEQLAEALTAAGDPAAAREVIDAVLATPWRTALTWRAADRTYRALGLVQQADGYRRAALAADPHVPL